MHLRRIASALLLSAAASLSFGCGEIQVPVELALTGDNSITIVLPALGGAVRTTVIEGGASTLMTVNMGDLFKPGGIPAGIEVTGLLIAGTPIKILPTLDTGVVCLYQNPDAPGGGSAVIRPFHHEADFYFEMSTIIELTNQALIDWLGLEPLPFSAVVDESGVPITLNDMLAIFLGGGGGGLEISTVIETVITDPIPLFQGAEITAALTLATVDAQPVSDNLTFCAEFLATP